MSSATPTLTRRSASAKRTAPQLSRREVAELGGIPLTAVNKAVEQGAVEVGRGPRGSAAFALSELAPLVVMSRVGLPLPAPTKRKIRDWLTKSRGLRRRGHAELALSPALVVRYEPEVADLVRRAEQYTRLRDKYIEIDPEVKGGVAVIKGTRLTASAVAARLAGGDSIQGLVEDYPHVDPDAFEVAAIYARTHPRRGRPPRPRRR